MQKEKQNFSFRKRIYSFKHAFRGLRILLREEHNSRIHLFFVFLSIACGIFFKISLIDWCMLFFAIGLVFVAECFNSAIENTVDLFTESFSHKAEKAKDLAAAGVLVAAIISLIIGLILFVPKFWGLIK